MQILKYEHYHTKPGTNRIIVFQNLLQVVFDIAGV